MHSHFRNSQARSKLVTAWPGTTQTGFLLNIGMQNRQIPHWALPNGLSLVASEKNHLHLPYCALCCYHILLDNKLNRVQKAIGLVIQHAATSG